MFHFNDPPYHGNGIVAASIDTPITTLEKRNPLFDDLFIAARLVVTHERGVDIGEE
jgi:hypothetical protein